MEQKNFDWRNEAVNSRMIPYPAATRDPSILGLECESCKRPLDEHLKGGIAAKPHAVLGIGNSPYCNQFRNSRVEFVELGLVTTFTEV